MSDYCHKREFFIRHEDVNFLDELKPSALLSFAQDAAGTSADELGFGYDDLRPFGYGFVVVSTCCEIFKPARPKEILSVKTWPLPPRRVFFERAYAVEDQSGERVASLASRWCLVDFASGKMLPPEALKAHATCPYRDERTLTPEFNLEKLRGEGREVYSMTARASHLDHFRHVNNAKYADFFTDCFSREERESKRLKSFRISYSKQVKEGDTLVIYRKDAPEGVSFEARVSGEPVTRFFAAFEEGDEA